MKQKFIDLSGICICLAAIGITLLYADQIREKDWVLTTAGIGLILFIFLAVRDGKMKQKSAEGGEDIPSSSARITEIVLLNEEDSELMVWDMYGKTALLIGRDVKENQVDIDLGKSPYASMVEIEHAVLNYSSGNWYVEDLGSQNGISVKKAGDGKRYQLLADTPCRLDPGDCLFIGMNRLLLR